jgi:hypothetical protein
VRLSALVAAGGTPSPPDGVTCRRQALVQRCQIASLAAGATLELRATAAGTAAVSSGAVDPTIADNKISIPP